jgi:uncharacterized protein (UPF0332 family)
MNPEFEDCLKKGKIKRFSRGRSLVEKELKVAATDLDRARASLERKDSKWATIQSYYYMFHAARALLCRKNYRERSHYCLIIAIQALYVEKRLLPLRVVEGLKKAKTLRENADYYDEWSELGATTILKLAEELLDRCEEVLKET